MMDLLIYAWKMGDSKLYNLDNIKQRSSKMKTTSFVQFFF